MTTIPFNRKTAKPGDKLFHTKAEHIPIVFKGLGFDGDVIVTFEDFRGNRRDAIQTPAQQLMLEAAINNQMKG